MNSKKTVETEVLILGAGLAGLSTGYHLKKPSSIIIEREKAVGGSARSFQVKGFTFDFTGHLLHLHNAYTRTLITRFLKGRFFKCVRKSWIYSSQTFTKYPFQANTHGLPDQVIDACVLGFMAAEECRSTNKKDFISPNLKEWSLATFGRGISEHFMLPYNEKLFQTPARQLSSDWVGPFVPTPKLSDVIRGALVSQEKGFGYNTTFLYPKTGGIQVLAEEMAKGLDNIHLDTKIVKLDFFNKIAHLSNGMTVRYKNLVNTIPLPQLLKIMTPLPAPILKSAKDLKAAPILCLNVGIKRAAISKASWIYFPEKEFPFYRVGFPMNFTPHAVPRGCSSMYIEIPMNRIKNLSNSRIVTIVRTGLLRCGIVKPADQWAVVQFLPIPYAYVICDKNRPGALKRIFSFFHRHSIQSIGRYGGWKYSFMEEAILDGQKAANDIA